MTRYRITVCPGCGRKLGVNGVDIHRLKPETPRDGRESSLSVSPHGRSRSRSSQAASQVTSRSGGAS